MKREIIIDAANKKLGRVASNIALALRGKTDADFLPHRTVLPKVIVKNVDKINFSEKRLKNSFYARYSGYPSGRKTISALEVAKKDKREVLRRAISGMLPRNRLKKGMIKNLIIYHGEDR
ncbi:50S ribosomal protein L13 [Candidatus Giovannonibacteria bacterium RIFCSPLOWO2_01_FULL_44_40]|uniref:Large ribosomal subunit protein uL13 n=1 Tax=Candidatus Giovannonibacteria bacterium RIFCSPHIGHO2_01_FULL_45_23 TaxID=1798325 RepID=A0A1F5VIJ1_9BACT|nr:MAG: 50S ribosomal protein L13 [Candidatus Giovannonibacteria bacterium RIFCSPHIGHO2_01_FULL_45_23]OGF75816.1 MAG: 50S ribosomal protein L13 [Candidatus Giovannonibacteria bacterium RIFCSPHIGHO2_02_FULL_45_13]OGF80237.1 MAG: 50S ribosomal protein L13 [Candidatus Giovannonibacteria bacterium RIFCSPLOWO2_01_FULL_44_40]